VAVDDLIMTQQGKSSGKISNQVGAPLFFN